MATLNGHVGAFYLAKRHAVECSSDTDYVSVPDSSAWDRALSAGWSFEAWARFGDVGASSAWAIRRNGSGSVDVRLGVEGGKAMFSVTDSGGATASASDATERDDSAWHHFIGTVGTDDYVDLYVDGNHSEQSGTPLSSGLADTGGLRITENASGAANEVAVSLARIYNMELAASQVSDLYAGNVPAGLLSLIEAEWMGHEGEGTSLYDASGNGHEGTVPSGKWVTTTYDSVSSEEVSLASSTTGALAKPNPDYRNLTVTVAGVSKRLGADFHLGADGGITFHSAQPSDIAVVSYRHWPIMVECGGFMSWGVDVTAEVADSTDFRGGSWRTFAPNGLRAWTGTAERYWVTPIAPRLLSRERCVVRFYLDEANGKYLTGWAAVNGFHPNQPVDALITETLDFQGTELFEAV